VRAALGKWVDGFLPMLQFVVPEERFVAWPDPEPAAALVVLPDAFNRPLAVPEGIALIGLGVALWRNPGDASDTATTEPVGAVLAPSVR
jgi:hypothetical protein